MLVPTEGGQGFSQHYDEALQRDPDVVFAHATVAKLLRAQAAARLIKLGDVLFWAGKRGSCPTSQMDG